MEPYWEAYWEARKPMETWRQYTESNSGAQQSPSEGRQDQKSSAATQHGGPVHSGPITKTKYGNWAVLKPFWHSRIITVCLQEGDPCNL